MSGQYVGNATHFLIQTLFGLYILIVMLRFLLQLVRADFYNPISQIIVTVTQPVLTPLRRIIPGYAGIDLASVALMLVLKCLEIALLLSVSGAAIGSIIGLLAFSAVEVARLALNVFVWSILIQVILSWIQLLLGQGGPGHYNPVIGLLHSLNEPLLGPARRLIPPISGLDLSPLVVLIGLQLVAMTVIAFIGDQAQRLLMSPLI